MSAIRKHHGSRPPFELVEQALIECRSAVDASEGIAARLEAGLPEFPFECLDPATGALDVGADGLELGSHLARGLAALPVEGVQRGLEFLCPRA
jgi:hypothetical protein